MNEQQMKAYNEQLAKSQSSINILSLKKNYLSNLLNSDLSLKDRKKYLFEKLVNDNEIMSIIKELDFYDDDNFYSHSLTMNNEIALEIKKALV